MMRAGDYERDPESGLLLPRRRGIERAHPQWMGGPGFFGGSVVHDPNYSGVSLLLHGDGTNGSTTFTDNGPSPQTVTAVGSAQIATAQSKFGGASMAFNTSGTAGNLTVPNGSAFDLSSGDFTIEAWIYLTTVQTGIICQKAAGSGTYPYQFYVATNKLAFRGYNSAGSALQFSITGATTLSANTWYFAQARRSVNDFAVALNGTQDAVTTVSGSLLVNTDVLSIGNYNNNVSNFPVNGYLDDFRITKGVARAFATPTAAFPNS